MGDVGVGAGKAELGVYIVPVVVVAADVGEAAVPVPVVMTVVSGAESFKNAFASVMVTVDNLDVDEPLAVESWMVMRDKVGVKKLLDCVASCGCSWVTGAVAAATAGGGSWV